MAFQLAVSILIGVLAGKKLDAYFQTEHPYFTALLSILALFAGLYLSLKDLLFPKK
ncbi:MAG: AtpZ/AtpI family protein [Saprospiraceae bacterium]|nr:AtpZ/AtpI family protein [Saprospiraceae bacterium]MCB0624021.1 AtpZ/AtpI family protein [Saprospiraceae bacterium]MCB0678190.1 AtpZ/AtpI family protein [Saprospiraceae bacterium]MCB0682674.1 AtpZ/AtpI family protein [Saprospiraceae bacterium]